MSERRRVDPHDVAAVQTADVVANVVVWVFWILVTMAVVMTAIAVRDFAAALLDRLRNLELRSQPVTPFIADQPPIGAPIHRTVTVEVHEDPPMPAQPPIDPDPEPFWAVLNAVPVAPPPPPPVTPVPVHNPPAPEPVVPLPGPANVDPFDGPPPGPTIYVPVAATATATPVNYAPAGFDADHGFPGNWFAVTVGKSVGVYQHWTTVSPFVTGVKGAVYALGPSRAEAFAMFRAAHRHGQLRVVP